MSSKVKSKSTEDLAVEVILVVTPSNAPGTNSYTVGQISLYGDPKREGGYLGDDKLVGVLAKTFVSLGPLTARGGKYERYGAERLDLIIGDLGHPLRTLCERSFGIWKCVHPLLDGFDGWVSLEKASILIGPGNGFKAVVKQLDSGILLGNEGNFRPYGDIKITDDVMSRFDEYLRKNNIKTSIVHPAQKLAITFSGPKSSEGIYRVSMLYGDHTLEHACTIVSIWHTLHSMMKEIDSLA